MVLYWRAGMLRELGVRLVAVACELFHLKAVGLTQMPSSYR